MRASTPMSYRLKEAILNACMNDIQLKQQLTEQGYLTLTQLKKSVGTKSTVEVRELKRLLVSELDFIPIGKTKWIPSRNNPLCMTSVDPDRSSAELVAILVGNSSLPSDHKQSCTDWIYSEYNKTRKWPREWTPQDIYNFIRRYKQQLTPPKLTDDEQFHLDNFKEYLDNYPHRYITGPELVAAVYGGDISHKDTLELLKLLTKHCPWVKKSVRTNEGKVIHAYVKP